MRVLLRKSKLVPEHPASDIGEMMRRYGKVLEWALSVGIPVLIVAGLYLKLHPKQSQNDLPEAREAQIGDRMAIPEVDWGKNRLTLVIVMQVGCYWCEQSAPFFQELARQELEGHQFHIVAVLPQPAGPSQAFLRLLNVDFKDIRQKSLDELGISGTPTFVLLDLEGKIKAKWVGKPLPEQEKEIFRNLGIRDRPSRSDPR